MTDWKRVAEAVGVQLTPEELEVAVSRLSALEEKMRSLAVTLDPGEDLAVRFDAGEAE